MDENKFNQALEAQACDVVDTMLSNGHIPDPDSIRKVCKNGNLTLLQTLLQSGKYDMDVQAGLLTAILYRQTHLLDHLFLAGADVNLSDADGNTPLHDVKDKETCKWLLDMGARQVANKFGQTPLDNACYHRYTDVAKLLLSHTEAQSHIRDGETLLHSVCNNDCAIEIVSLLLSYEQGVQSIPIKTQYGETCLHKACNPNGAKVVELLLTYEQGVQSISLVDYYGETALYQACCYGAVDIVKLLLSHEQGVQSILIGNNSGYTPLHAACHGRCLGNIEIVRLLLMYEQGVQSILTDDNFGNIPLHGACFTGNVEAVKLLLSHKQGVQSISMENVFGETPMDNAKSRPEILALLQNASM